MYNTISVKFADFWPTFDHYNNIFVDSLSARFTVEVVAPDDTTTVPELLIYSRCGQSHYRYENCIKIYYTGENDVPNFNECDYAISFHDINFGNRHMRYPLYLFYEYDDAKAPVALNDSKAFDRDFCSCVIKNHTNCDPLRIKIAEALETYRPIAYGGPWRNNVGEPVDEKIPFIANYKFNLALENSAIDGYVTEKILEAFAAKTVPLYYGASNVAKDFNPESFINVSDYDSIESFVRHIKSVDGNKEEYLKILRAPALIRDTKVDFDAALSDFLCDIAYNKVKHTTSFGEMGMYHRRDALLLPMVESKVKSRIIKLLGKI